MKKEYTVLWGDGKITVHHMDLNELKKFVLLVLKMETEKHKHAKIFQQVATVKTEKINPKT